MKGKRGMDKLIRNAGRKSGGKKGLKFEFELTVRCVTDLPPGFRFVLVSWQRGPKVACTRAVQVCEASAEFGERLTILATLFLGKDGCYDAKESRIVVREANPGPGSKVGRALAEASLDLAAYAAAAGGEGVREEDLALALREPDKASPGHGRRLSAVLEVRVTSTALFGPGGSADGGFPEGRSDCDFSEAGSAVSFGTSISEDFPAVQPPPLRPGPSAGLRWRPGARLSQVGALYALSPVNSGGGESLGTHQVEQDLGGLEFEPAYASGDEGGTPPAKPAQSADAHSVRRLRGFSASAPVSPAGSPQGDRDRLASPSPALPLRLAALSLQTPTTTPRPQSVTAHHSQQTSPAASPTAEEGLHHLRTRSAEDLRAGVTQLQRRLAELEKALASARVELAQADYDKYEVALDLQRSRRELKRCKEKNVLLARQLTSLEVSASKKSSRWRKRADTSTAFTL